ncbi:MAG: ATPase domain-containing protein [Candidatus Eisenbacteria bacterium]
MESKSSGRAKDARALRGGKRAAKVQFLCSDCGDVFAQWFGRCPSCQAWNTLNEYRPPSEAAPGGRSGPGGSILSTGAGGLFGGSGHLHATGGASSSHDSSSSHASNSSAERAPRAAASSSDSRVVRLDEVPLHALPRLECGIGEFDRILGGGLVPGSLVLVGGDPGIGKSTLLLQVAGDLVSRGARVLYVSGEESAAQIRLRSGRLPRVAGGLELLAESNLEAVAAAVEAMAPRVLVIDSIQSAFLPSLPAAPGSLLQVRESALGLLQLAKQR